VPALTGWWRRGRRGRRIGAGGHQAGELGRAGMDERRRQFTSVGLASSGTSAQGGGRASASPASAGGS